MSHTVSTAAQAHPNRSIPARWPATIVRILLGVIFLIFGLNGFMNFMPVPKDLPQEIITVMTALTKAGYVSVVSGAEILVAVLLLTNRFVPLALVLVAPILVGILTFHIAMARATIGPGIVVTLLELFLVWVHRDAFKPMLATRAQ